jgi:predicted dehydrogenase
MEVKMLKVAITGAGYAAHYYVKALTELGYPIVGITNRTKERGLELAKEANTQFYDTFEELLEKSDAKIICIATATTNHLKEIQIAAENGVKWIFCEKPAGFDISETQKIKNICEKYKTVLGIGYKMRFESIFSQAKKLVSEGRIGELVTITINFYQTIPHSSWYLDNGFIRETMAHPIDLSNWFAASPPKVAICNAENHLNGLKEDIASLIVKYDSGVTSSINGGWIADYPYIAGRKNICFELVGTGGYICGIRPDKLLLCDEQGLQTININIVDSIKQEFQDFVYNATNGLAPSIGISDAIQAQEVIDAAIRSAASGGVAAIDRK